MTERYRLRGPAELDAEQLGLYERIVHGPRRSQAAVVPIADADGRLLGPFGPMTIAPVVGDAVQAVGAALRFGTTMTALSKEAAILLVAARRRCAYEWVLHEPAGRAEGLAESALATLRDGVVPVELPAETAAALAVVDRLLEAGTLSDAAYAAAIQALGERMLAELVWLVGYYSMLATALAVFDPPLGAGTADPWKDKA